MAHDTYLNPKEIFSDSMLEFEKKNQLLFNSLSIRKDITSTDFYKSGGMLFRKLPMSVTAIEGSDVTGKYKNTARMFALLPTAQTYSVPLERSIDEMNDEVEMKSAIQSGLNGLEAKIYSAALNTMQNNGATIVTKTSAAGISDIADIATRFNGMGIDASGGNLFVGSAGRSYSALWAAIANKATPLGDKTTGVEEIPMVGGYNIVQLPNTIKVGARGATAGTIDITATGGNYYVPKSTESVGLPEDGRFQTITFASLTGTPKVNDSFMVDGLYAVNGYTKLNSEYQSTYRIVEIVDAANKKYKITPPMITGLGGTAPEIDYQNSFVETASASAAVTFLNSSAVNPIPFWIKDSIEMIPVRTNIPDSNLREQQITTDNGFQVILSIDKSIDNEKFKMVFRTKCCIACLSPERAGLLLPSQAVAN